MKGKVIIVGAGPGAVDLLTLRAAKALETAGVVLYDNLIPEEVLGLAEKAEMIYVGRKCGDKTTQEERQNRIHTLMLEHVSNGKIVVRLKSGDPYIYGRAAEEARFLRVKNIEFEVVPGISAGLAASNLFNIPLTERKSADSVYFATAHKANFEPQQWTEIISLLKKGTTVILYMGLKSLHTIVENLKNDCFNQGIHVCGISKASWPTQKLVEAPLEEIVEKVHQKGLDTPSVFILGKNAKPI